MRIALIHAVQVAIQPLEDAFQRHWPHAEHINLLDDALSVDRNRASAHLCARELRDQRGHHRDSIHLLATFAPSVDSMARELEALAPTRARDAVARVVKCPVLASADSAVLAMRKLLG
jgi:hypothetical protein